jgi:hypothetical protein
MASRSGAEVDDLHFAATPAEVEALRRARVQAPLSSEEYERFLAQFVVTVEELRRKRGPRGEPFRL